MKKRETWKYIVYEPAKSRLKKNQCPNCGLPKEKWKRRTEYTCCSKKCTEEYYSSFMVITSWTDLRMKILQRDNYTCQKCGKRPMLKYFDTDKDSYPDDSQLIADHIIPIALGGEQWDSENIQTLCIECNKIKTKQDASDIAKARKRDYDSEKNKKLSDFIFPTGVN